MTQIDLTKLMKCGDKHCELKSLCVRYKLDEENKFLKIGGVCNQFIKKI